MQALEAWPEWAWKASESSVARAGIVIEILIAPVEVRPTSPDHAADANDPRMHTINRCRIGDSFP
jgi:hypothetical protein